MADDYLDDFFDGPRRSRPQIAKEHMQRLNLTSPPEHPIIGQKRAERAAATLGRQDRLFEMNWMNEYRTRYLGGQRYTTGDPDGDMDANG